MTEFSTGKYRVYSPCVFICFISFSSVLLLFPRLGVISAPDVREYNLDPADEFIMLGSNGAWEHTNEVDILEAVFSAQQDAKKNEPWSAAVAASKVRVPGGPDASNSGT